MRVWRTTCLPNIARQVHQRPGLQHITAERRREITSCPWQSLAPRDTAALCIITWSDGGETGKRKKGRVREAERQWEAEVGGRGGRGGEVTA